VVLDVIAEALNDALQLAHPALEVVKRAFDIGYLFQLSAVMGGGEPSVVAHAASTDSGFDGQGRPSGASRQRTHSSATHSQRAVAIDRR